MKKFICSPALWLVWGLFGISFAQWVFFRSTLKTSEDRIARVAYQALSRVLEQAHRMKDDLTLQEAIQGVSRAPGVMFAGILDANNKVIAHTQPAQLGKVFAPARHSKTLIHVYTLQDAQEPWGRLVLGLSGRVFRMSLAKQGLILFGLNLCAWLSGLGWWWQQGRSQVQQQKRLGILEFHNRELETDLERLRLSGIGSQAQWTFWMQQALELIPKPTLFLDSNQRVSALNRSACQLLEITQLDAWRGKSWQDIPVLSGCGDVLQRSIECPGQKTATTGAGILAEFVSEKSVGGTWIFFH